MARCLYGAAGGGVTRGTWRVWQVVVASSARLALGSMVRMKAIRWISFFSIIIAVTAAVSGWKTVNRLRAENEALRAELQILKHQHAAAAETASLARDQELQRLRADAQEVLRLRGEITQLRSGAKEAEKLRGENQQLR